MKESTRVLHYNIWACHRSGMVVGGIAFRTGASESSVRAVINKTRKDHEKTCPVDITLDQRATFKKLLAEGLEDWQIAQEMCLTQAQMFYIHKLLGAAA